MKNKIIAIVITLLLIIIALLSVIIVNNNQKNNNNNNNTKPDVPDNPEVKKEEVTITFDVDGGVALEPVKVEKGSTYKLTSTTKDGYTFKGWFIGEEEVKDDYKFEKDTTIKAKWEKIPEKAKTFTVSFDSKGGNKVNSITVECGKTLPKLPVPKQDFYEFVSWADKHGKVILEGSLLSCENVTLYANWEYDGPTANPEQNKTYKCPDGYTLNGTKCTKSDKALKKCPTDTYEFTEGRCFTLTATARKDSKRACGKTTVHTGGGHTEEVTGEFFQQGAAYCYFKVVTTSDEQNQSTCNSRGHKWNSSNNKCYYYRGNVGEFVINSCDSNYAYLTTTEIQSMRQGATLNGGCFPYTSTIPFCETGWSLSGTTCTKTIDATLS